MKNKAGLLGIIIIIILAVVTGCSVTQRGLFNGPMKTGTNDALAKKYQKNNQAVTMTDILSSNRPMIIYHVYTDNGSVKFNPKSVVSDIGVVQNGNITTYVTNAYIKDFDGLSDYQVIIKAKRADRQYFDQNRNAAINQTKKAAQNSKNSASKKALKKFETTKYVTPEPQAVKIKALKDSSTETIIQETFRPMETNGEQAIGATESSTIKDSDGAKNLDNFANYYSAQWPTKYSWTGTIFGLTADKYNYGGFTGKDYQILIRYPKSKSLQFSMDNTSSAYVKVKTGLN